jgi:apolipoprotein N-acyltransferase
MNPNTVIHIAAAAAIGVGLRFVVNLEPVWWLAWFVPGLLLWLALRTDGWTSRAVVALAALIGVTANVPFLLEVMPVVPVIIVMLLQTLLWMFAVGAARRVIKAFDSGWTVLAYPVIWVAADTLLAHLTPDGNWGSLAYTQADILPVAQLASVFGVGGVLFVVMLLNSALALALYRGRRMRGAMPAYAAAVLVVVTTAVFGWWRLQTPVEGTAVSYGIVSIDDYIEGELNDKSRRVWRRYIAQVRTLAAGGATIILLPEKIAVLSAADATELKLVLGELASANRVWLIAGLGVDNGKERRNEAWWFAPDGRLATNYLKHFMAPPEREFVTGNEYPVNAIDGVKHGVAICKDMHFASLGRGFGTRDAAVMLVPAWDFHFDAWMAANMTKLRGVENGYAVVRSSRAGLLSVSDAYGRMEAVAKSTPFPGTSLSVTVNVGPRVRTIYTSIGDSLGWLCVAGALAMIAGSFWRLRRAGVSASEVPDPAPTTVAPPLPNPGSSSPSGD